MNKAETKYIFFTGKGGVGKTSMACATAVKMAEEGNVVLLVSTDPASNLKDVLESPVDEKIKAVDGIQNLFAININPENSAEEYRNRVTQPLEGIASKDEIKKIREDLSGACTIEIASFDEFSRFISGEVEGHFDIIIFDTAPTGHTLRLLELPAAWSSFTEENPDGASCLGPTSALKSGKERYFNVVNKLKDTSLTSFYIVARADKASLKEASRTHDELLDLGMTNQYLYINGIFKAIDKTDIFATNIEAMGAEQLQFIPENLKQLPLSTFPLLPYNILGANKLRSIFNTDLQKTISENILSTTKEVETNLEGLKELVNSLCENKKNGLIMTMGKGGVGKTITASAIAVLLAQKGFEVLLTTTDPAAHIQVFVEQLGELPPTLSVERIDPKIETQNYIQKVLEHKGKDQSEEKKKLILEDLKSPCTEEVAVFHAFSKAINQAKRKFVVMDTAPTGHTLLLLDTAGSYHRDIMRNNAYASRLKTPYMSLQDQELSKIILVSLAETTPMREAASLQSDLERAGIKPYAWLVNQSLSMHQNIHDPLLKSRSKTESEVIDTIQTTLADKTYGLPFIAQKDLLPSIIELDQ